MDATSHLPRQITRIAGMNATDIIKAIDAAALPLTQIEKELFLIEIGWALEARITEVRIAICQGLGTARVH